MVPHRVGGVGHQIDDDLMKLGGVGQDRWGIRVDVGLHLHGGGHRGAEELHRLERDVLEAGQLPVRRAGPGEGEQLADHVPRPPAGLEDLRHPLRRPSSLGDVFLKQMGVPHDRGEDVVEVVGDSSGQGPHRLQLL